MGKGMRAGRKPSAGKAGNMQKQLAQVQAMQARMQQAQERSRRRRSKHLQAAVLSA